MASWIHTPSRRPYLSFSSGETVFPQRGALWCIFSCRRACELSFTDSSYWYEERVDLQIVEVCTQTGWFWLMALVVILLLVSGDFVFSFFLVTGISIRGRPLIIWGAWCRFQRMNFFFWDPPNIFFSWRPSDHFFIDPLNKFFSWDRLEWFFFRFSVFYHAQPQMVNGRPLSLNLRYRVFFPMFRLTTIFSKQIATFLNHFSLEPIGHVWQPQVMLRLPPGALRILIVTCGCRTKPSGSRMKWF